MTIEIHVPDIGADEVEVTEILVKVGDSVVEEQSLISVEGDKASMEVPAPQSGVVSKILVEEGDTLATGALIMEFEAQDGASSVPAEEVPTQATEPQVVSAEETEQEVFVPDIGSDEVEVTEIYVSVGDTVKGEQDIVSVEGDKASMDIPAPFAGTISEIKIKEGDKLKTGSPLMTFKVVATESAPATKSAAVASEKPAPQVQVEKQKSVASAPSVSTSGFVENASYAHASPVVRRLAREFGVDLSKVNGSGRKNRVIKEDVQTYVAKAIKILESGGGGDGLGLLPWPEVDFSKFGETKTQLLSKIKKVSGANLHRNWVKIPHVTQWDETDITEMDAFRKEQNALEVKAESGMKLTPLVFVMKAVAKALREFPEFNASLSTDGENLILKQYVNIGIAVDTPKGLVVPVFKDVDKKGIYELSQELKEVSGRAREGKLTAADMQGGCFSISSLGGIGGTSFTPIINAPEVAILGLSKSSIKPIYNGEEFEPRLMLPMSLSYDHRVIDGVAGAKFITYLNAVLSDIRRLVL